VKQPTVTAVVARPLSMAIYDFAKKPSEVDLPLTPWVPELTEEALQTRATCFKCPYKVSGRFGTEGGIVATHYHTMFRDYGTLQEPEIQAIYKTERTKLSKNKALGGSLAAMDYNEALKFDPADGDKCFDGLIVPSKVVLFTGKALLQDVTRTGWVFKGLPCWLTVHRGIVGAIILTAEEVESHSDLSAWLKAGDGSLLKDNQVAVLHAGDSMFIPCGASPIFCGLPDDKDFTAEVPKLAVRGRQKAVGTTEYDPFCIGVHLMMCARDAHMAGDIRRAVASTYNKHLPLMPKCIKDIVAVTAWVTEMAKDDSSA